MDFSQLPQEDTTRSYTRSPADLTSENIPFNNASLKTQQLFLAKGECWKHPRLQNKTWWRLQNGPFKI